MKARRIILVLLVALSVVLSVLWARQPRTLPLEECSDLYRRYEHVEGIDVSFIKDFPLNDTTTIDVTLLQATTDAGWDTILNSLPDVPLTPYMQESLEKGQDVIRSWYSPRGNPSEKKTGSPVGNDACYISYLHHTLAIFPIENEQQLIDIEMYQLSNLKNTQQNEQEHN